MQVKSVNFARLYYAKNNDKQLHTNCTMQNSKSPLMWHGGGILLGLMEGRACNVEAYKIVVISGCGYILERAEGNCYYKILS